MSVYRLILEGCDDSTEIDVELTAEQHAFVTDLAAKFDDAVTYGCMPGLLIRPLTDGGAQ